MKRFQWFGYDQYYPGGGSNDIEGEADSLDELRTHIQSVKDSEHHSYAAERSYNQVLDMEERRWLSADEVIALGLTPK